MRTETDRLCLRPLAMTDAEALGRLQGDPEMMRYFGDGHVYGEAESRTWLEWHVAMWELEGYGFWAVERKPGREFIGWLGANKVWEPPELVGATELGWFIDRRHWGEGLATEGARQALDFVFGPLGMARVIARYDPDNAASGQVMEKIGMRFVGDMADDERPGRTVRVYEATS